MEAPICVIEVHLKNAAGVLSLEQVGVTIFVEAGLSGVGGAVVEDVVGPSSDGEGVEAVEHAEDLAIAVAVDVAKVDRSFYPTRLQSPLCRFKLIVETWIKAEILFLNETDVALGILPHKWYGLEHL